jgi:predicted Co/Zn/Cd cation transporter (cation efflux family)
VLVSPESQIDIETADAIRREVSERLDAATPTVWLTIDFTADRRWL